MFCKGVRFGLSLSREEKMFVNELLRKTFWPNIDKVTKSEENKESA
jgi:hypothetical protein